LPRFVYDEKTNLTLLRSILTDDDEEDEEDEDLNLVPMPLNFFSSSLAVVQK
jgi:hypothetical protein